MRSPHDREILRLAVPAFLALVAEPLFLLADAAILGHLSTTALAGLGIAAVVIQTAVGLCVFLAYGTTASVARHLGAGDRGAALAQGLDGLWLAVLIGLLVTAAGFAGTGPLVAAFGASAEVTSAAETYLRIAFLGTVPLLLMLAATGVLRGLQDTATPLVVAVIGNGLNVVLNLVLVFGLGPVPGFGIAGSAWGSVIAQVVSAGILVRVVVAAARRERASLRPDLAGIRAAAHAGVPLVVRTLTLRAALLVTTYAVVLAAAGTPDSATGALGRAGDVGSVELATHQLAMTIWTFLAFVLDALAIAAQALTGRALGAGDVGTTRALTRRMTWWGLLGGAVTGVLVAAASPVLGALFTPDQAVRELLVPVLLVVAAGQPVAGVVFVLDGVLIGAGDGVYLAWGGLAVLVAYAPLVLLATALGSLVWLWVVLSAVFMGGRAVVLLARARTEAWLVTGAPARSP